MGSKAGKIGIKFTIDKSSIIEKDDLLSEKKSNRCHYYNFYTNTQNTALGDACSQ